MIAFLPPLGTRVPRGRAWLRVTRWVDEARDEAGGQTVEKLSCLCVGVGGGGGDLKQHTALTPGLSPILGMQSVRPQGTQPMGSAQITQKLHTGLP